MPTKVIGFCQGTAPVLAQKAPVRLGAVGSSSYGGKGGNCEKAHKETQHLLAKKGTTHTMAKADENEHIQLLLHDQAYPRQKKRGSSGVRLGKKSRKKIMKKKLKK